MLNVAVIETDFDPQPIASPAFAILNGHGLVKPRYIWIVRIPFMMACVEENQRGQAYPAINDADFAVLPFPLPALAQQYRIVAKIDALMALCDRLERASPPPPPPARRSARPRNDGALAMVAALVFAQALAASYAVRSGRRRHRRRRHFFRPLCSRQLDNHNRREAIDGVLNVLASSMLAVTVFSVSTMVAAYGAATNNVTPRATCLLMEDNTSKNVLGTFIGSFLFSLVGIIALSTGLYGDHGRAVLLMATIGLIALIAVTILRWGLSRAVRPARRDD